MGTPSWHCYCDNSKLVKCCWLDQLSLTQIKLMAHVHKAKPQHHIAGDGNILLFIIQEKMWFLAERASNNNSNDKTIAGVTRQLSR